MNAGAITSVLKAKNVRAHEVAPAAAATGAQPAARSRCAKSVQLLSVQGAVRAIELRCSCGEATVIELEYPETA
ncbi:MAG TPA: hypothetical protein VMS76_07085 [Planctomycetota bacterium]|nr:hypothetical protein [Planctomycetota bacterium]